MNIHATQKAFWLVLASLLCAFCLSVRTPAQGCTGSELVGQGEGFAAGETPVDDSGEYWEQVPPDGTQPKATTTPGSKKSGPSLGGITLVGSSFMCLSGSWFTIEQDSSALAGEDGLPIIGGGTFIRDPGPILPLGAAGFMITEEIGWVPNPPGGLALQMPWPIGTPSIGFVGHHGGAVPGKVHAFLNPTLLTGGGGNTDASFPPVGGLKLDLEHKFLGGQWKPRMFITFPDRSRLEFEGLPISATEMSWRKFRCFRGDYVNPDWETTFHYSAIHGGLEYTQTREGLRFRRVWTNYGDAQNPIWRVTRLGVESVSGTMDPSFSWDDTWTDLEYDSHNGYRLLHVIYPKRRYVADTDSDLELEDYGVLRPIHRIEYESPTDDKVKRLVDVTFGGDGRQIYSVEFDPTQGKEWRVISRTVGPDQFGNTHTFAFDSISDNYTQHTSPSGVVRTYWVKDPSGQHTTVPPSLAHLPSAWQTWKVTQDTGPDSRNGWYGHATLTWEYWHDSCGCGRLVKAIYPSGITYEWSYDLDGRGLPIVETVTSGGHSRTRTWSWIPWFESGGQPVDYRLASRLLTATDFSGLTIGHTYSMQGGGLREVAVSNPAGSAAALYTRQEDALGRVIWEEEPQITTEGSGGGSSNLRMNYEYMDAADTHPWRLKRAWQSDGANTRTTTFTYSGPGHIKTQNTATTADPSGRTVIFTRDVIGQVTEVQFPQTPSGKGNSTYTPSIILAYDEAGRISRQRTRAFTADGASYSNQFVESEFIYDAAGRMVLSRREKGALASGTDDWLVTTYLHDAEGRLTQVTGPGGQETQLVWDGQGMLYQTIRRLNSTQTATTRMAYNPDGVIERVEDASGATTVAVLDAFGRTEELQPPDNRDIKFTYDDHHRLISRSLWGNQAEQVKTEWIRDADYKRVTQVKVTVPNVGTATKAYSYNGLSRVSRVVDESNRSLSIYYDSFGQVRRKTDDLLGVGQGGNQVEYLRDSYGRVQELVETLKRDNGSSFADVIYRKKFYHDKLDRLIKIEDFGSQASALTTSYLGRDSLGNVTWLQEPETGVIAGDHKITEFGFDAMSRMTFKKMFKRVGHTGSNEIQLGIAYNDNPGGGRGQVITRTDGLGNTSVYEYDLGGRLVQRKLPGFDDASHRKIWTYSYDLEGRLMQWVDGNNAVVKLGYDSTTKQLEKRWLAVAGSQTLSETLTNEKFAYDALERPYRAETFWGFFGDANGPNPSAQLFVRADNNMDGFGRTLNETFGYLDLGGGTPVGYRSVVSGWGGSPGDMSFRHKLTTASGYELDFMPDAAGKLDQIDLTLPAPPANPPNPPLFQSTGYASYRYEGVRRIWRAANLNGGATTLDATYSYNALRYLVDVQVDYGASTRYTAALERDLVGNVLSVKQEKVGRNPGQYPNAGDVYALDGYDRLVNAQLGVDDVTGVSAALKTVSYQIDEAHNRSQVTTADSQGTSVETYELVSGTNEYSQRDRDGELTQFTYDGNGNLVSDGFYLYEYDYLDRLSKIYLITYPAGLSSGSSSPRTLQVSSADQRERRGKGTKLTQAQVNDLLKVADKRARAALVVSKEQGPTTDSKLLSSLTAVVDEPELVQIAWYWYDPHNRRVYKLTALESTFFAYDGWQYTDEFNVDLSNKKTFFASDRLDEHLGYAIYSGGNWVRFGIIQDHLGSVVRVTDDGGSVVERYEYDSYGQVTVYDSSNTQIPHSQAGVQNFLGFAGHGLDLESGLLYMRNRYYLPGLGRFLTQDPIGIWSDASSDGGAYVYAGSRPVFGADRLGLFNDFNLHYDVGHNGGPGFRSLDAENESASLNAIKLVGVDRPARLLELLKGNDHAAAQFWRDHGPQGDDTLNALEALVIEEILGGLHLPYDRPALSGVIDFLFPSRDSYLQALRDDDWLWAGWYGLRCLLDVLAIGQSASSVVLGPCTRSAPSRGLMEWPIRLGKQGTAAEEAYAKALTEAGHRVFTRFGLPGPDFVINGAIVELKTITSGSQAAVRNALRGGLGQSPLLIIDARNTSLTVGDVISALIAQGRQFGTLKDAQGILIHLGQGSLLLGRSPF